MIKIYNEKQELLNKLKLRNENNNEEYLKIVKDIISDVIKNKDSALTKYTKKFDFDNFSIEKLMVTPEELKEAYDTLDEKMKLIIKTAKDRISNFHQKQIKTSWIIGDDEKLGIKYTPIKRVGLYIPGGAASYFSSLLMAAIPAIVAGVKEIIITTPPNKEGLIRKEILASAYMLGLDKIYKVGGAQAIAAMAYGTESIMKVDKIIGPGNIFVALAKKEVFGQVGIDSFAGPSEILIISDKNANPKFVAADLLSQAEHDFLASSILITNSLELANQVKIEVSRMYLELSRKTILDKSLLDYSGIIIVNDLNDAFEIANEIAPEHLELMLEDPFKYLDKIENAGAIFLGDYTPEALGDYMAGPNHIIPTNKTSRFFSPLGTEDFMKRSSVISFNKKAFQKLGEMVHDFAQAEGLDAHALSAKVRMDKNA